VLAAMEPKREKDRNGDDARYHGGDREEKKILSAMRIEYSIRALTFV
jgi:hypothetical protein